jgi:N-acetylglucosaminyl-diphospho-decaprenol L-rhamnosyltransferase
VADIAVQALPDGVLRCQTGVVVVAHSRTDLATRCVESLGAASPREHIIVVLNAPDSADPADRAALERRARVITPPGMQGYGANLNLGVRSLPKALRFVLLANDDVELCGDCLDRLLLRLNSDEPLGVIGPAIRNADGSACWAYAPFPSPLNSLLSLTLLPLGPAWKWLSIKAPGSVSPADVREDGPPGFISGAVMLVRRDAFDAVRGFDEDFYLYYEEADFCFRLREAGWKIGWDRDASAIHFGGSSTTHPRYQRMLLQARRLYLLKRIGRMRLLAPQVAQAILFGLSCTYNAVAATIQPRTWRERLALLRGRYAKSRIFGLGG